ncbi:MAG: BrnT family toxin [Anaerolineae bacterium]|nr:BrnT family toxin [Anaerolineae bacterium]
MKIQKHGLDFADAYKVFENPMLIQPDDRYEYDEDRWIGVGLLNHLVVVVVYVERNEGQVIRFISMRQAMKYERRRYEESITD